MDYGSNNIVKNCYIEGDIDFIFGSADCIFIDCNINAVRVGKNAYFTAPDTLIINQYGFIFKDCKFTTDLNLNTYLIRPWYPSGAPQPVYPRITIIDSEFYGNIDFYPQQMKKQSNSECVIKFYNSYLNNEKIDDDCIREELLYLKKICIE